MNQYFYKAQNVDGLKIKGIMSCNDEESLNTLLREKGYYIISVSKKQKLNFDNLTNRLSKKTLIIFCKQLASFLGCGINLTSALDMIIKRTSLTWFKSCLYNIQCEISKGESLKLAFERANAKFPAFMINMIQIGEQTGNLEKIFNNLCNYFEREDKVSRKIKSALAYPIFLFAMTIAITSFLMIKIVPTFADTLAASGHPIPLSTKAILYISANLKYILFIQLFLTAGLAFCIKKFTSGRKGRKIFDGSKLKIPLFSKIYCKVNELKIIRSMWFLLESGNTVFGSFEVSTNCIDNIVIVERLQKSMEEINKGVNLASSISHVGLFEPWVISMIYAGEESGNLEEMLRKVTIMLEDEVNEKIDMLVSLLEPVIIVFLALIIGTIVFSIMMPIFNIMDAI